MSSYFKYLTLFLLSVLGLYLTFVSVTSLFFISIYLENRPLLSLLLDYADNIDRLSSLSYITSVLLSLFWIYKAHKNIEQKGIKNLDFSNKACVYWWFVPILSLWKPYYIVKEIFLASKFANDWKDKSAIFLIIWWWLFLISILLSKIVRELPEPSLELVSSSIIVEFILSILYIKIIYSVYKFQNRISLTKAI